MFDTQSPPTSHRSRPHTCSATGSLLLAASVPATIRAISHPLSTVAAVAAAVALVLAVRTLRARPAARSTTDPAAVAARRADGP